MTGLAMLKLQASGLVDAINVQAVPPIAVMAASLVLIQFEAIHVWVANLADRLTRTPSYN